MGGGAGAGRAWWGRAPQLVMTKPASASARRLPGGCSAAAGGGGGGGEGGSVAAVGVAREEAPLPPSTMAAPRGRVHGMGGVRGEG
jgi:hypothetical protein